MTTAQEWVEVLLNRRAEACREKNIDRLMSLYSPDIVYFDVVPPLQGFVGLAAVRGNFLRWFDEYEGKIGLETRDQRITVAGDVAFVHMLHIDKGNIHFAKAGLKEAWVRSTVCCRRSPSSEWLITHEHISWPFEFNRKGGRPVMTPAA
jgi:ketosteroid isomerase-like protein